MKRSVFLGAIAIAPVVAVHHYNEQRFPAVNRSIGICFSSIAPKPSEMTVDELTAEYGEPEDVILLNAARANEALGVILAYKDFLVVEGRRIDKSDITDVTFNNSGTPYAPGEYQVIIATSGQGFVHINTGYDATWTKDVVELIKKNL